MWLFRPKVDSPEVASPDLLKLLFDSIDDKQHSTTPLSEDDFCLDCFAAIT